METEEAPERKSGAEAWSMRLRDRVVRGGKMGAGAPPLPRQRASGVRKNSSSLRNPGASPHHHTHTSHSPTFIHRSLPLPHSPVPV